jgi:hypothetical protein
MINAPVSSPSGWFVGGGTTFAGGGSIQAVAFCAAP